jgi:hypothetical protein
MEQSMKHYHVAIWIDHTQARIFSLNAESANEWTVHPHDRHTHLHHKAGSIGAGKSGGDPHYFHAVADAVKDAGEILITGPGTAKLELIRHLHSHDPQVEKKVVGVESLDHPTDGQLVGFARQFFKAADRMR